MDVDIYMDIDTRLNNCYFIKTMLLLFVVLGHCMDFWNGNWFTVYKPIDSSITIPFISGWLNSFHIYGFIIVSGYIYAFKKNDDYRNYKSFIIKKIKRLIFPYFFVAIVWVIPLSQLFFRWPIIEIFKKYVLAINPSQLWFLWMLFWVFLIIYPLDRFLISHPYYGYVLLFLFHIIGRILGKTVPDYFCFLTSLKYILVFYIGVRMWRNEKLYLILSKIPGVVLLMLDLLAYYVVDYFKGNEFYIGKIVSRGSDLFLGLFGGVIAFVVLQKIAFSISWWRCKTILLLKDFSFHIYLFHQQIIYFVIKMMNGLYSPVLIVIISFCVSSSISIGIAILLNKNQFVKKYVGL